MRDKGFSYSNKVQQYHGDGRESIIVMGKPFKVLENLSAPTRESRRRLLKDKQRRTMVFLVENTKNLSAFPRHFALKRSSFSIDQVQEAHHEIEMLSRLSDKNIVKSYHCEVSRHEGQLGVSICTEYCANNLWKRIQSGKVSGAGARLSESEIANILLGITSALGYLHAQQPPIAYRNIHPENILISNKHTGPQMYKLCNFSMATTEAFQCVNSEEAQRVIEDREKFSSMAFLAPEMADPHSQKRIDEQVDMWALGVLLYSMMYMKLPFEATITTLSKNPRYRVPQSSSYSGCFQTILQHLLDPDPKTRWNVFALTNFLRFDEDIGRHLSTFCFTCTEYPEGWEEQDVFVIGRARPEKNPPVTYDEGAPVARVGGATTLGDNQANFDPEPPAPSNNTSIPENDPGFQRALQVLETTGDIDDPRVAPYKDAIIKQQTAMWSSATGETPSPSATNTAAAPPAPPVRDELEDLFGSPEQPSAPAAGHYDPLADAFGAVQVNPNAQPPTSKPVDAFSADDLFAPVAPTANQGPPSMWNTGAPAGYVPQGAPVGYPPMGNFPPGGMPGVSSPSPMGMGYPAPPGVQSGGVPMYGGVPAPAFPPQQQPQQPVGPVDFMAPMPGTRPMQDTSAPSAIPKKEGATGGKKDPFADLFNF